MDVTQIPFAKHIGIVHKNETILKLDSTEVVQNHIQSIHASAQYTLAETQTGLYLQEVFPQWKNKVGALLRSASVKYKSPATTAIFALAYISDEHKKKFLYQLERKGRATVLIDVKIYDTDEVVTMEGSFTWFIQTV